MAKRRKDKEVTIGGFIEDWQTIGDYSIRYDKDGNKRKIDVSLSLPENSDWEEGDVLYIKMGIADWKQRENPIKRQVRRRE